jgi:hypothetical protein
VECEHGLDAVVGHLDDQVSLADCREALLVGSVEVGRWGQGFVQGEISLVWADVGVVPESYNLVQGGGSPPLPV